MEPDETETLASKLIWQDPRILDSFDYSKIVQMIEDVTKKVNTDMAVYGPTFSAELSAVRKGPRYCRCNESLEGRAQPMIYAAAGKEVYAAHICMGCKEFLNSRDSVQRLKETDILVLRANADKEGVIYG